MKLISACLFGTDDKYLRGAVANAELAPVVYPGWRFRLYVGGDVPRSVVTELDRRGCEILDMGRRRGLSGWLHPLLWRFSAVTDPEAEAVVVRDVDSRFNEREAAAVDAWLASGRSFHIMRDHPDHRYVMLAGMWGCRGGALPDLTRQLRRWQRDELVAGEGWRGQWGWGVDQDFLRDVVYPRAVGDGLIHSDLVAFPGETTLPFPTERRGSQFVGEAFDAAGDHDPLARARLEAAVPCRHDLAVTLSPHARGVRKAKRRLARSRPGAWLVSRRR